MRILAIFFAIIIVALQWPLWVGKGSWLRVWQLDSQLSQHRESNAKLKERNDALEAEVQDLKNGTDAIEERARNELGMIRQGEVFFQVLDQSPESIAVIKPNAANTAASSLSSKAY
ncbi:cell division protein FtsB [Deefgea piscis]|uniref:cell division protein FtsB n=1 Tax=Deefgea piscis TaxID=2739061 RepID=UPI001C80E146|nr:cell division protein FtsB [Deefgea piscis]QZA79867.1 cell division protein FtsB [Deefgea piscis]